MRVIRAHDGHSIVVNQLLSQFSSLDDLLNCFSLATEIPSDAIICMTSDGSQLKDEFLQHIIQQESQSHLSKQMYEFFVFNREFLYTNPDHLIDELAQHSVLEATPSHIDIPHPPTPKSLEALVAWSAQVVQIIQTHDLRCKDLLDHIGSIARSSHVALLNLQAHASSIDQGSKALSELAAKELSRMQNLLDGHQRDLQVLGMVTIHPRLLSLATNASMSTADSRPKINKERTLADYISKTKMSAVADACNKVYTELRDSIAMIDSNLTNIQQDTEGLSAEIEATNVDLSEDTYRDSAEASLRANSILEYIETNCSPDPQGWPVADKLDPQTYDEIVGSIQELILLDQVARQGVDRLTQDKNDLLERSLHLLQDISSLQSEYADIGAALAAVDTDLHSNKLDGFKHLNRLKNMLWVYGATVVEVVRRREFAKHFLTKSQSLAELMAKLSASERKRRQEYRSDVFGQLPWEVKGMEEVAPSLEITTSRISSEGMADLGREDLEALFRLLDTVHQHFQETVKESGGPSPIAEVKAALQQLATVLDDLDADFIHLVNAQLLGQDEELGSEDEDDESGSETSIRARRRERNRKRLMAADHMAELEELRNNLEQERKLGQEKSQSLIETHKTEVESLQAELEKMQNQINHFQQMTHQLENEKKQAEQRMETLTTDLETEQERRLNMADEVSSLRKELEQTRRMEAEARQEAVEEGERVNELEAHGHEMQLELEEARAARLDASNRIEALLSEGSSVERELSAAQARIDELTEQVSQAHTEISKARETISEIEAAKERQIRNYRAEADGDRAILEEKVRALEAELKDKVQELQTVLQQADRAEQSRGPDRETMELLRAQLRAADDAHEEIVKEMEHAKEIAEQAQVSHKDLEMGRQHLFEKARSLLGKSHQLRKAVKAMPTLSSSKNSSGSTTIAQRAIASAGGMSTSIISETDRQAAMEAFEADMEGADLEVTLEALRVFDPAEMFDEVKTKLDSLTTLVRKWQKAYKNSNEKTQKALIAAREKIAFRNFQAGDLALFLPTRNSTAKPWAAFNISFPHFFLRATGPLAEQLKTKEWIVARITSITDQIATNSLAENGQEGNPFQLAEGVRFYLLDVETWNGNSPTPPSLRSRKGSAAFSPDGCENGGSKNERKLERSYSQNLSPISHPDPKAGDNSVDRTPITPVPEAESSIQQDEPTGADEPNMLTDSERNNDADAADKTAAPSRSATPAVETPQASPEKTFGSLAAASATSTVSSSSNANRKVIRSTTVISPNAKVTTSSVLSGSTTASPSAPSGLTRALRASSPVISRYNLSSGRPWPTASFAALGNGVSETAKEGGRPTAGTSTTDGSSSNGGDSSSKRSAIIENAAAAPAFGRGRSSRQSDWRGHRHFSPPGPTLTAASNHALSSENADHRLGLVSAPASQGRSSGIIIPNGLGENSLTSQIMEAAMTNPFSQSPGPFSMPERDALDGSRRRKTSMNISSTVNPDEKDEAAKEGDRQPQQLSKSSSQQSTVASLDESTSTTPIYGRSVSPKVQRWKDPDPKASNGKGKSREDPRPSSQALPVSRPFSKESRRSASTSLVAGSGGSSMPRSSSMVVINGNSLLLTERPATAVETSATATTSTVIPGAFPSSIASSSSASTFGGRIAASPTLSTFPTMAQPLPSLTVATGENTLAETTSSVASGGLSSSTAAITSSSQGRKSGSSLLSQTLNRFTSGIFRDPSMTFSSSATTTTPPASSINTANQARSTIQSINPIAGPPWNFTSSSSSSPSSSALDGLPGPSVPVIAAPTSPRPPKRLPLSMGSQLEPLSSSSQQQQFDQVGSQGSHGSASSQASEMLKRLQTRQ